MTSTTDDALLVAHQQWIEAWKHNDPAALLSILAADVVLMPPNDTAIYGIVEAREWLHEYFEHFQIIGLAVMDRHVTLIDDHAIERWGYQVGIQPIHGGDKIRDEGRFLMIWKREPSNDWKISQIIWNSSRPIGSGTSRFMALLKERLGGNQTP